MATFLFIDYFASNYILAAIITYLFHQVGKDFDIKIRVFMYDDFIFNRLQPNYVYH
jgi:small basic protein